MLRLARLDEVDSLAGSSALGVRCDCRPGAIIEGFDGGHMIRVDLELGEEPFVQYSYPSHTGQDRALMLQSLGYVHHVLHRWWTNDLAPVAGLRTAYIDAGDLASFPGSIGYDRRLGDVSVGLIPDVCFYMEQGYEQLRRIEPCWSAKRPQFVWRGSTTGAGSLDCQSIIDLPRYRLCSASLRFGSRVDAGFTHVVQARSDDDAAALQALLVSHGLWRKWMGFGEIARCRYVIDIDGNAGSWSFFKKLLTGSCVVKVQSVHEQWFSRELTPWIHYVPIEHDLSNIEDIVRWCFQNDETCRTIAEAGRAFALERDFVGQMSLAASTITAAAAPGVRRSR